MTLEELQQSVNKDFKLDDTELDRESVNIPLLHNKYLIHFNKFNLLRKKADQDYKTLIREKWEYYTGKADPAVYQEKPFNLKVLRQDVDKYIKSDPEVNKLEQKVTYIQTTVNYLERTLKLISNRTFTIKNAVDWKKFTSGVI